MTSPAPTLPGLADDAALLSLEHQLHLGDVVGDRSWHVDLQAGRFTFAGGDGADIVATRVHLLGSAAPGPRSWLWGWANPSGYPEPVVELGTWLRDAGSRLGLGVLSSPEVPFDQVPGAGGDARLVAAVLTDVAKVTAWRWTSYCAEVGGGTWAAFLLEHPSFALPAPTGPRVVRVLTEGLSGSVSVTDRRRAVASYAAHRPLGARFASDGSSVALTGPGFAVDVRFDELGRLAGVTGTLAG